MSPPPRLDRTCRMRTGLAAGVRRRGGPGLRHAAGPSRSAIPEEGAGELRAVAGDTAGTGAAPEVAATLDRRPVNDPGGGAPAGHLVCICR